jgi:hypothetical protein
VEEYLDEKVRRDVIKEIGDLELPEEWKPQQVIDYIIRKINRK